jgi:hypothetical protein
MFRMSTLLPHAALPDAALDHAVALLRPELLLAHQGGWDEALMVIVPVAVFGALLYVANKRAARLTEDGDGTTSPLSRDVDTRNERSGPR